MRKVMLCDADARLFGEDILPLEVEFYYRHLGAFKQMWPSQGRKFWLRVVITFRWYTVNHGALKDYPEKHDRYDKYNAIFDQMLIYVHDQIVSGRLSSAKNLISDIITLAANRASLQYLSSKSFSKDPFYYVETRETFRRLFGEPNSKTTILKVYLLFPVFLKLGGALVRLLRLWMDAVEELSDSDDFYWLPNTGNIYRKIEPFDDEDPPDFDSYIESLYSDPKWYTFPLPRNMSCVGVSKENGLKRYKKKPKVWWFYPYDAAIACDDCNALFRRSEPSFMREIDMHISYLEIGVLEKVLRNGGARFEFEFRSLGKDLEKELLAQAIEKERLTPWRESETDLDSLHSILARYFTDILKKDLCSIALRYRHPQDTNECKYLKIEKRGFLCVDPEKEESPEGVKQTIIEAIAYAVKDLEKPFCPENAVYRQSFSTFCATAKPIVSSHFKELMYRRDNSKPLFPDAPNSQYCFRETSAEEAAHQKIDLNLTHSICPATGDVKIFEGKNKVAGSDRSSSKKKKNKQKKKKGKTIDKAESDLHQLDKTDISATREKESSSPEMHPVLDQAVENIVHDVFDKIQEKGGIQMKQTAVAGKFRRKEGTYDLQVTVEAEDKDGMNITSTVEQRVDLHKEGVVLPTQPNSKFTISESGSALIMKPKPAVIDKELKVTGDDEASQSTVNSKQSKPVSGGEESESVDDKELKSALDKKEVKPVADDKTANSLVVPKNTASSTPDKKPSITEIPTNRICATCWKMAPPSKKYRKCQRCRDEGVLYPRYYCSRECQSEDWQTRHLQEHKEGTLEKKNQES